MVKTIEIRTEAAPHAFLMAAGFKDSWARTNIWVGSVVIGSLKEWGMIIPEKVVAVNMTGAVELTHIKCYPEIY